MALWLCRAGKYGEHETKFFTSHGIYFTWEGLEDVPLATLASYDGAKAVMQQAYAGESERLIGNYAGQLWAFVLGMKPGDVVAVPRKGSGQIALGEITGGPEDLPPAEGLYRHRRAVTWRRVDVPRAAFGQDLLYSLSAAQTICQIERNDAEKRVRAILGGGVGAPLPPTGGGLTPPVSGPPGANGGEPVANLAELAREEIAKLILRRYKGHGMARLVEAVLQAQGYVTHLSPEGPDGGIDILAGSGHLGFAAPRLCVQVKSADGPADGPTVQQLIGAMKTVNADQGLFVSWGGFKASVHKTRVAQFFSLRLWDRDTLIEQVLAHYDQLPEDVRTALPLIRVWSVAPSALDVE